jgi:hypothetical protein
MKKKKSDTSSSDTYRNPDSFGSLLMRERFLTVCLYPETNPHVPWIRLRGLWLRQAGFTPKSRVRVRVMPGCLVITKE